jgi:hypothetical protein
MRFKLPSLNTKIFLTFFLTQNEKWYMPILYLSGSPLFFFNIAKKTVSVCNIAEKKYFF